MFRRLLLLAAVCLVLFACDKSTEPKYTIQLPTFSPAQGTYFSIQNVHINDVVSNATIRYTLDGTDPTTSSPIYSTYTPITVTVNTTIKARAYKAKMKTSAIATSQYTFSVGTVFITPLSQTSVNPLTVTMTSISTGTVIRYTTDGTDPVVTSTIYTAPFVVDGNVTVKARGFIDGWSPSDVAVKTYNFDVTQPSFSVATGLYYNTFDLTISTPTPGASIHYTTDGTEPLESSSLYTDPITISTTKTIKAKAFKTNWNSSGVVSADYTLKVTTTTFSPSPQVIYNKPQVIAIATTTPETKIYYTTDNSAPTVNAGLLYSSPITVTEITTIKAIAVRPGWTTSNITTGVYNLTALAPTFNPGSGQYAGGQVVAISCATPGAEIRYTTNNSDPNAASTLYSVPITISANTTVRAKAFKTNWNPSSIAAGIYQISNTVANPVFDPPAGIYFEPQTVTLACSTPGAEIHFSIDGSEPTNASTSLYSYPIPVSGYTEIKAKAFIPGWTPSETVSSIYQFDTYNQIVAWGNNTYNQTNVPLGTDFAQIDAGKFHTVALRTDGSIAAWGRNDDGQCNYPAGNNYVAVAAGDNHSLALKMDGTVVAWGLNEGGQCDVPDSLGLVYTSISAGSAHSLALTDNNKLVAWGNNDSGQCDVPADSNFTKISAGANHNLALKDNGMIAAWGNNDNGQINAPTGTNYIDIAAGDQHSVAKRTNGTLVAWGNNDFGQTTVPSGTGFVKISAGYRHNLALKTDGTIISWGYSGNGLGAVPTVNTYMDVSAGGDFSVALKVNTESAKRNHLKNLRPKFKLK